MIPSTRLKTRVAVLVVVMATHPILRHLTLRSLALRWSAGRKLLESLIGKPYGNGLASSSYQKGASRLVLVGRWMQGDQRRLLSLRTLAYLDRGAYCSMVIVALLNLPLNLPPSSPARKEGLTSFLDHLPEWLSQCM